jgi:hypothetical protein
VTRPTVEEVQHTQDLIYLLADRDEETYRSVAFLIDAMVWVHGEAELARKAAGWGPGTDTHHTIGRHGLGRPTEDRLEWGGDPATDPPPPPGRKPQRPRGGEMQPPVEPADRLYKQLRKAYLEWRRRLVGLHLDVRDELQKHFYWPKESDEDDGLPRAQDG